MANNFNSVRTHATILLFIFIPCSFGMSTNFVNPDMPYMRPTFVVNFDISTVICQLSSKPYDIDVFNISILCDGFKHCYSNPAIHDESFPLCDGGCVKSCGDHGTCLNDGEIAHCFCDSGYHGDACQFQDSNECRERPCSMFATCTNTLGSYYCTCMPGYKGDGFQCTDVDECIEGQSKCPELSTCVNLPGTYYCNCTDGYVPDGVPFHHCVDVDECYFGLSDCDDFGENLLCQNKPGSFLCTTECSQGFVKADDKNCMDTNECENESPCGRRSICENYPGDYGCKCEPGFIGDGFSCDPIDTCNSNPDVCAPNAFCIDALSMCFCQKGYIGDGITCNDIDECAEQDFPCANDNDYCLNVPGTFLCCDPRINQTECKREFGYECLNCAIDAECKEGKCVCKQGLQGDPYKRCHVGDLNRLISFSNDESCGRDAMRSKFLPSCVCVAGFTAWKKDIGCIDIDECEEDTGICGAGEWCANTHGSYLCCTHDDQAVPCIKAKKQLQYSDPVNIRARLPSHLTTLSTHEIFGLEYSGERDSEPSGDSLVCGNMVCGDNAICIAGECRCIAGYSGQPDVACFDVNECIVPGEKNVCPEEGAWCVNSPGAYYCCNPGTKSVDCIGLVIEAKSKSQQKIIDHRTTFIKNKQESEHNMIDSKFWPFRGDIKVEKKLQYIPPSNAESASAAAAGDRDESESNEVPRLPWQVKEDDKMSKESAKSSPTAYYPAINTANQSPNGVDKSNSKEYERPIELPSSRSVYSGAGSAGAGRAEGRRSKGCVSNDECGADAICERRSGVCRCTAGFVGHPPTEPCQDADECALNLHDCHRSSICRNHLGGYTCQCPQGHRPIGRICIDINECSERNPCHPLALCKNEPGSVQCFCPPGLIGDGYTCHHSNQTVCTARQFKSTGCSEHQECFAVSSTAVKGQCGACFAGYELNSTGCHDIDECDRQEPCGDSSHCVNTVGGYFCECDLGYTGDGQLCMDIDECRQEGHCHPQATCVNTNGGYICQCPRSWKGDGIQMCLDPKTNTCLDDPCLENSVCLSLDDGHVCQCKPGYTYNKQLQLCQDVNECEDKRDQCNPVANCINRDGSYHCECQDGYRGNGQWCLDINECSEGTSRCDPRAHCTNLVGSHQCKCPEGLEGDGYSCQEPINDTCPPEFLVTCKKVNKKCEFSPTGWYCGDCLVGYYEVTDSFLKAIDPTDRCADTDECEKPDHGCHKHAVCYNLPGSYRCRCRPGYTGDGKECWLGLPGSDCSDPSRNDCDKNADCIDVNTSRHFCSCREGFIGDGVRCDDVDECFLPQLCSEHADCVNTPGSYSCQCRQGYTGDGVQCSALCPGGGTPDSSSDPCSGSSDTCPIGYECHNSFCCPVPEPTNCEYNKTLCHQDAQCLTGRCVCEPGFRGDGLVCIFQAPPQSYQRPIETTVFTPQESTTVQSITTNSAELVGLNLPTVNKLPICGNRTCHQFADCLSNNQCHCWPNFVGDGEYSCIPDPDDCVFDKRLCGKNALCRLPERRCMCPDGQKLDRFGNCPIDTYTYNEGVVKTPKEAEQYNKKIINCVGSYCQDEEGTSTTIRASTRLTCAQDPSICSKFAYCSGVECVCNLEYIGDGINCHKRYQSQEKDEFSSAKRNEILSNVCNGKKCSEHAECVSFGGVEDCRCNDGFRGNGLECNDVNECVERSARCAEHAKCVNTAGSYGCVCSNGYRGDGYDYCSIDLSEADSITVGCDPDGLALIMRHSKGFKGQIFVQSQSQNPFCSKHYTKDQGPLYKFKVNFAHCDVKKEKKSVFSTTVVVQQHPLFVTDSADVYHLKCSYPSGSQSVMDHFNVSEIQVEEMQKSAPRPTCQLDVTDYNTGAIIDEAIVGQRLKLTLSATPQMFGVLPSNCIAVNMDQGETYALTDEVGCAIEPDIFPEWLSTANNVVYANFKTFKWPDSTHLRFQCDCAACLKNCDKINCAKRRQNRAGTSAYTGRRRKRSSAVNIEKLPTFSPVVTIKDTKQETQAQKEFETWISTKSAYTSVSDRELCIPVLTLGLVLALLTCLASTLLFVGVTCFCKRRWRNGSASSSIKDKYAQAAASGGFKIMNSSTLEVKAGTGSSETLNYSKLSLMKGFRKLGDKWS